MPQTNRHTDRRTDTQTHRHTDTQTQTQAHRQTDTHTHTHTNTQAHTHTLAPPLSGRTESEEERVGNGSAVATAAIRQQFVDVSPHGCKVLRCLGTVQLDACTCGRVDAWDKGGRGARVYVCRKGRGEGREERELRKRSKEEETKQRAACCGYSST